MKLPFLLPVWSFEASHTGYNSCPVDVFHFFNLHLVELHFISGASDTLSLHDNDYNTLIHHVPDPELPKWDMAWNSEYQSIRHPESADSCIQYSPTTYWAISGFPGFISITYSNFKRLSLHEKASVLNYELTQ